MSKNKNILDNEPERKQIRVLGIANTDNAQVLADLLNAPDINSMGVLSADVNAESVKQIAVKASSMPIDAIILYTSEYNDNFQLFMDEFTGIRSGVASVLVTDSELNVDLLQSAMASGINKVVSASKAEKDKVQEAIRKEASKKIGRNASAEVLSYDSRVILVYSSKGGSGKTTISVNMAAALARKGKKVTIIDLDLASGDVHSFLGVKNNESIAELAEEQQKITPAVIKSYVRSSECGINVVCAPAAPQHAGVVTPELIADVITTLRTENDYVIVDCDQQVVEGNIAACNAEAMKIADMVLFVVTPEVPTLNGAYEMIYRYLSRRDNITDKIKLVVNKAGSDSTITDAEIAKTLDMEIFASIPDDYRTVVQNMNIGTPFMISAYKNGYLKFFSRPIMQAYDQMVRKIIKTC